MLLNVIEHGVRGDREAFLFGAQQLPKAAAPRLASAVFPEAGYATLRSSTNDLTAIMKFGPHGGGHGHYDKLNFILFSHGITLAEDPGTHFYGLPIHREWDSITIAHNTISIDGQRQAQATGKLLEWQVGDGWTAVRADAGAAYTTANLQRTILLTPGYASRIRPNGGMTGRHCLERSQRRKKTSTSFEFSAGRRSQWPYWFASAVSKGVGTVSRK